MKIFLLTKKLYQFIFIFYLLFTLTLGNNFAADGWEEEPYDRVTYHKHPALGTCVEQTKPSLNSSYDLNDGFCLYGEATPIKYEGVDIDISNWCIQVGPCIAYKDGSDWKSAGAGQSVYLINWDGRAGDNIFELYYPKNDYDSAVSKFSALKGGDKGSAYETFAACKADSSYKGVIGLKIDKTISGNFKTVDKCKSSLSTSFNISDLFTEIETQGKCTGPKVSGKPIKDRTPGLWVLDQSPRCNCFSKYATVSGFDDWTGVYLEDGNNNRRTYFDGIGAKWNSTTGTTFDNNWYSALQKCVSDNKSGKYYYSSEITGCFESFAACENTQCGIDQEGDYTYNGTVYKKDKFGDLTSDLNAKCSGAAVKNTCLAQESAKIQRCNCSVTFNADFDVAGCAINPGGSGCEPKCKFVGASFTEPNIESQRPQSPLAFIKVFANLLFWIAVVLFIINFVTAGIEMVRSGDEPEKMKEATERVTSSIFGFVFILVVGGLVNYLLDYVSGFIN